MACHWLDIILLVVVGLTVVLGLIKGFIREVVGVAAVITGLIVAAAYYENLSLLIGELVKHKPLSDFLSFFVIFSLLLLLGSVIARILSRWLKGPGRFYNHLIGGIFGFLKGVLICGVVVLAFSVFPVNSRILEKSCLAPVSLRVTKEIVRIVPEELKVKFKESYNTVLIKVGRDGQKI